MHTQRILPEAIDYPSVLRSLPGTRRLHERNPPPLYVRGVLPDKTGIAIVGTRNASPEAIAFTRELARDLVKSGYSIWSGGARGIDGSAHEGALDADGATVAVMGGGLSRPYPPEHGPLFERIVLRGGALISLVDDEARPTTPGFLRRNQVLAAMTAATVVVEAGLASGARSTAAAARRLGRPLLVVPHSPWSVRGEGCAHELAAGARAVTSAADVIAALRGIPPPLRARASRCVRKKTDRTSPTVAAVQGELRLAPELSFAEQTVLSAIDERPTHIDAVCEATCLGFSAVAEALLTLTLYAVVVEGPAGFYRRANR